MRLPAFELKWRSYLVAILIIAVASGIRAAFFGGLGRGIPYLTYYPAVMLAALYPSLSLAGAVLNTRGHLMKDPSRANHELIEEISALKKRVQELEQSESKCNEIPTVSTYLIHFMIVVVLFVGGLTSGTCKAASNPQEVRVGSELDFPPYASSDDKGQPTGFSVDLIKAVTNAMGLSIKISTGSWDTMWNSLVSGQIDVLPIVARLPERQHLVDFSLPHTETYDAFFVRKGDPAIPNIAAAHGKEIVVMRSDAAHHQLLERKFEGKLILVDTIPAGLSLISSGKHNAFLCSKLIGTLSIKEHGITGLIAGPMIPDYKRAFSFAVKKGDTELLEKLNQGLLIVKTNGEYDRIYNNWLSFDDPWRKVQKYLLPIIIVVIAFAMIAGVWLVMLQLIVRRRTRELAEKNKMLLHAHDELEVRIQERTTDLAHSNQLLQSEITEHKRVAEALRHQKEMLQIIFDSIPFMVAVFDREGHCQLINHCWQSTLGWSLEEMQNKDVFAEFYPDPEYREYVLDYIKKAAGAGRWSDFKTRIRDGQVLDTSWINVSLSDGSIIGIGINITERKRVEELLREERQRLAGIIKGTNVGTWEWNVQTGETIFNDRWAEIIGYTLDEISPVSIETCMKYADPDDLKASGELLEKHFHGEIDYYAFESRMKHKDGSWVWVLDRGKVVTWSEDGKPLMMMGTRQDITEHKWAEEELNNNLEFITILLNTIPNPIFYKDTAGKYLGCNSAFEAFLGKSREEIIGKSGYDMSPPEISDKYAEKDQKLFEQPGTQTYEWKVKAANGSVKDVIFNKATFMDSRENVGGLIGIILDVTERKRAEEELKYARDQLRALAIRLEEAREETRTTISLDLHDDVGGNLAGLKMDLMKLEGIASKVSDVEQRNSLMEVSLQSRELINKTILSARRIMMELRPSVLDDFGLVAAFEWQAGEFKTHTSISCQFIAEQEVFNLEKKTATAVFRIFQEALANVVRHSGATEVIIRLSSDKEMLVLEVIDNGRGITEEQLLGKESLGLMGMRERALVLEGNIQVRGESGKGTTVTLRVPMRREG